MATVTLTFPDAAVPRIVAAQRSLVTNGASLTQAQVLDLLRTGLQNQVRQMVMQYEAQQKAATSQTDPTDPLNALS